MRIPQDIERYVRRTFGNELFEEAMSVLNLAVIHDGEAPNHRLIRCTLVASDGSLTDLRSMVELLAVDFRDVIVSGEYATKDGELVQIRDLSLPFSGGAA